MDDDGIEGRPGPPERGNPPALVAWCVDAAAALPPVGEGTATVWRALARTARRDVAAARALEPHVDARNILLQADLDGVADPAERADLLGAGERSSWGVFAAEQPGLRLEAHREGATWRLRGTKPWCSLAATLSHALVTAHVGGSRRLFAVRLDGEGVRPHDGPWTPLGLAEIVSAPVDFDDAPAVPVGEEGWYLSRPGFSWGGMSVAACWAGGAVGLLDALRPRVAERGDDIAHAHLGRADEEMWAARAVLADAARRVDGREGDARLLAARVREVVARAAAEVMRQGDEAMGPGPLATDPAYALRVADLHLYLRQHHGLRDTARLGRILVEDRG